jgi:transposase, IS5 family
MSHKFKTINSTPSDLEISRLHKLSKLGDPLERLIKGIDFEIFRSKLDFLLSKDSKGLGGRPAYDYVLLFKILVLQRYYNLSDDQTEYQISDRLSFMRFLGLSLNTDIPDSKTIWHFREQLAKKGGGESLFDVFLAELTALNLVVHEGKIVDASFVEVPKQRNSKEENEIIKLGQVPDKWAENQHKLSQKDIEARWTKKNDVSYYGYKDHTKVDSKSKIITKYAVTDASVHDSQAFLSLLDSSDEGQKVYADSAYVGKEIETKLIKDKKVVPQIIERAYKDKPLTDTQKENNHLKAKTRCRVEHVFGFIENSMKGSFIRSIGMMRAKANIGLMNLVYNLFRKIQLSPSMG